MKWIVSVHERNGQLDEFRVLAWSLDHPEIEFQWDKDFIVKSILEGKEYKTAYLEDGEYVEGADVIVIENEDGTFDLRTKRNDIVEDNLSFLPKFRNKWEKKETYKPRVKKEPEVKEIVQSKEEIVVEEVKKEEVKDEKSRSHRWYRFW